MFVEVLFNTPVRNRFTYEVKEDHALEVGMRVVAPFGKRELSGFAVELKKQIEKTSYEIKSIKRVVDKEPLFGEKEIALAQWISRFYLCSEGEALSAMIPGGRKEIEVPPLLVDEDIREIDDEHLSEEQQSAIKSIIDSELNIHYLYGITGSGKSEVYFKVAQHVIDQGGQVIYLVPEITLTHQLAQHVLKRFGKRVAILHSLLSPSQRLTEWKRIKKGEVDIVIGARSAIFAPFEHLKLIIIDEEHESSYKAGSTPRYHARQVAQKRASMENAFLIMGSATPSLEAYYMMSETNLVQKHTLHTRVAGGEQPLIRVVHMLPEKGLLSRALISKMKQTLDKKKQVILFLNRRGFSHYFHCRSCGYELSCPHCSISLTYHKARHTMICHYCGYQRSPMKTCPECHSLDVGYGTFGTEMVEQEVKSLFPLHSIERLDTDVIKKKDQVASILQSFKERKIDILLGTQMVAKGLNFPHVDLVGIVLADSALHLPDFRSQERTYSLIVQVSGRAGRFSQDGEVLVQTFHPDNPAILYATTSQAELFYEQELRSRKETFYPPYSRMVNFTIRSKSQQKAIEAIEDLHQLLNQALALLQKQLPPEDIPTLLGPAPSPIEKIAGSYRYHIVLRGKEIHWVLQVARAMYEQYSPPSSAYFEIDVDPLSML
ncbi:MAG: primosomal protein N' [Sphaerochaetaceae bacterium]